MNDTYLSREILLVADKDERSSLLLSQLQELGFMVTHNTEPNTLKDLLENKYFVVAIFELDTPQVDFGLKLLEFTKKESPQTQVFILATRESFHASVQAFRVGANDVVFFEVQSLPYLIDKIEVAASRVSYRKNRDRLLKDMASVHTHFFKKLLSMHIHLMETETRLRYKEGVSDMELPPMQVLLVDGEQHLGAALKKALPPDSGWSFTHCTWGSEALDHGASGNYQIALINKNLPDLPGSMIASTVQSNSPDTIILMFNYKNGSDALSLFDGSSSAEIPIKGDDSAAVAAKLQDLRTAVAARSQKEEHVKSFKAQNYEFLQKYSRLKNRYGKLMKHQDD